MFNTLLRTHCIDVSTRAYDHVEDKIPLPFLKAAEMATNNSPSNPDQQQKPIYHFKGLNQILLTLRMVPPGRYPQPTSLQRGSQQVTY